MDRCVLVTGGAGYVGSHVCKALAENGLTPVVCDSLITGHRWAVQWGPLEQTDLVDERSLAHVFAKHRPAAIVHMAGLINVGESVEKPGTYYRANVSATISLLECARSYAVDKMVFSSSAAVYGQPEVVPIPEEHPSRPINPYGATKHVVEELLRHFDVAHGFRSISLRYFNAAGADPDARIGEAHNPETHLIPIVLDAALGRRPVISVFGDDYETPDGTCVRDYVHVEDLAQAHLLALQRLEDGASSTSYNLGNGHGYSVREVIDVAAEVTGRAVPITVTARRPGDPAALVADASRANRELGWQPARPRLESLISDAWRWHAKHFGTHSPPH